MIETIIMYGMGNQGHRLQLSKRFFEASVRMRISKRICSKSVEAKNPKVQQSKRLYMDM